VIQPGESAVLHNPITRPNLWNYNIVAFDGDEASLTSDFDSLLDFIGMNAVPVAFAAGVAATIMSVGTLST